MINEFYIAMNYLCRAFLLFYLMISFHVNALDEKSLADANLCHHVRNDAVKSFKKQIKKISLSLKQINRISRCSSSKRFEGGSFLRLAIATGSINMASYLITSMPKNDLKTAEKEDGLTTINWIKQNYAGYAPAETIAQLIKEKLK